MLGDLGRDHEKGAVGNDGYAIDFAMMVANEFHMLNERAKTLPAWKGRRVDQ